VAAYVEQGYTEPGYIEGDVVDIIPENIGDSTKVKFFISGGGLPIDDACSDILSKIGDDFALMFAPRENAIMLGSSKGFVSFLGSDSSLKNRIAKLEKRVTEVYKNFERIVDDAKEDIKNINIRVEMKAPDGTVIAQPEITREGATFTFSVPEEIAGALYNVELSVTGCNYDQ
jgi:hypothetical protein